MELDTLKAILALGDCHGSAIRKMLRDLKICDLSKVTQEQAELWLARRKAHDGGNNSEDTQVQSQH